MSDVALLTVDALQYGKLSLVWLGSAKLETYLSSVSVTRWTYPKSEGTAKGGSVQLRF